MKRAVKRVKTEGEIEVGVIDSTGFTDYLAVKEEGDIILVKPPEEGVNVTIAYIIELYHAYDDEKLDLMATLRKIRGDSTANDKGWESAVEKDKRPSVVLLFKRYKELCEEICDLKNTLVLAPDTILNRSVEPFSCDADR